MTFLRRLLPYLIILIVLAAGWVWWNRPKKVDMAAYVPADSLLYLEANDLQQIVKGVTTTEGWKTLAGPAGVKPEVWRAGWFGRLAAWAGIGSADTIVFSRMQIAATVVGVAAADGGDTLNVKPRLAIVVETHSSERRTKATLEKYIGNFAVRAYVNPRIEKKEIEGVHWTTWNNPTSERRIVVAVSGSNAVIGNDESAVQACLAVRRGERPSLGGNLELEEARLRVPHNGSLAFGFMSSQGAMVLSELVAAIYVGQLSEEAQAQSLAANLVPQVAKKILGGVGWSTRLVDGKIEDAYFISLKNDAGARLRATLAPPTTNTVAAAGLLPADTYSLTRYETRDALTAWRGLNFSISSQLDPVLAILVPRFLEAALSPYGIEESDLFLHAIGPEVVTARLESGGQSTVLIVEIRDDKSLRALISKRFGAGKSQVEVIGDAEIWSSSDETRGAASFSNGYLVMGPKSSVRKCLEARQRGDTLASSQEFEKTRGAAAYGGISHVLSLTRDTVPARDFIIFMTNQRAITGNPTDATELEARINHLPYAVSEMNFVDGGIERRTRSTFGLLGTLATQFNPRN